MEELVPKMARRRSSDEGQSRKRWVRSCRWCPQALQEELSFSSCIGKRTKEGCDRGSEVETVHSEQDGIGPVPREENERIWQKR